MRIERTDNAGLISFVVTHPSIYPHISDDYSPAAEDYRPVISDGIYWLACVSGDDVAGVFMAHPWNGITYEIHTCILPPFRGPAARKATAAVLAWLFAETPCQKVVTHVPANNRAAHRLALDSGLKDEGINRRSFMKGGALLDQHILGITREEWEKCQQQQ